MSCAAKPSENLSDARTPVGLATDLAFDSEAHFIQVDAQPIQLRSPGALKVPAPKEKMVSQPHSFGPLPRRFASSPASTASDAGSAHDEAEAVSTDLGDDSESCPRSGSYTLADGNGSDCETGSQRGESTLSVSTEAPDDESADLCVYPLLLLLQLRATALRRGGACALRYSTRRAEELPAGAAGAAGAGATEERKRPQGKHSSRASQTPHRQAEVTSTSASPQQRRSGIAPAERTDDEKVARAARSILNKLTVEKFDTLHEKLATCGVKTPDQMALLMREIFEKATEQHHFVAMYADLCVRLETDPRLTAALGAEGEPNSFRRLLLGQCQSTFEKLFEPDKQAGLSQDPELAEELAARRKRRALGNVKLVGHLLVRGMLNSRLLAECADALLASHPSCVDALECTAALLTVAGPKFDRPDWRYKDRLDAVFTAMVGLSKDKTIPPRQRFLLQDVLDLRRAGWRQGGAGAAGGPGGPMRLEDVKKQAEKGSLETGHGSGHKHSGQGRCPGKAGPPAAGTPARGGGSPVTVPAPARERGGEAAAEGAAAKGQRKMEADPARQQTEQAASKAKATPGKPRGSKADAPQQPSDPEAARMRPQVAAAATLPKGTQAKEGTVLYVARMAPAKAGGPCRGGTQPPEQPTAPAAKPEPPAAPASGGATAADVAATTVPAAPERASGAVPATFSLKDFHRELSDALRNLAVDLNVVAAVRRIRAQAVPLAHQCGEFVDIITRASEEKRGPARRSMFAFAASLLAAEDSAFDRNRCLEGVAVFFQEVYAELCLEVPRLQLIIVAEFLPALRSVAPLPELEAALPEELRSRP